MGLQIQVGREFVDPFGRFLQPQLCQRADHALRDHPPLVGFGNGEGEGGQMGAGCSHCYQDPRAGVGSSTDNGGRPIGSQIHLANLQLVGVGMRLGSQDLAQNHPLCPGAAIFNLFHFKPRQGEGLSQFFG